MRHDEFLAKVRERGEYHGQEEAEEITVSVLGVLASRITGSEAEDLAAQLPEPLDRPLIDGAGTRAGIFGVEEFLRRVGRLTGARPRTAEWDASAVLSTLAEAVSGGELNQVLSQLPSGFAPLFGKPELSG
ncbi:Uncharacterized conserved protein, DUF2267 family [Streptomyces sp. WMMB 714]|jgi:uncharacterized protein (DUF2267 family)|uniref:DUF2267 domain-containing protein n=1 Tax=Streptomyces sp. WMMB 714 TaxID=1286822 RepID=UPI0005F809F0|nr:DUF2267 domain-containing protein [Streptomyces sp. WMMB 714]SCK52925.1 Uncharacterized conserved protein, DUF2267 family [Streptomyces sp. WMMB 714]